MVSRPMTPAPSPTLEVRYAEMDMDEPGPAPLPRRAGNMGSSTAEVVMRGKEKARELVGPDPRRESSLLGSCGTPCDTGQRGVLELIIRFEGPDDLLLRFQRFDKKQRAEFLSSLVDDLELDEAVKVSRRIEPRMRRDFLRELPLELALHCMSFVGPCSFMPIVRAERC